MNKKCPDCKKPLTPNLARIPEVKGQQKRCLECIFNKHKQSK